MRLHVPRGQALEPELLALALDGPPVDAVSLVHVETSTGVVQPVAELLRMLRTLGNIVTIVDGVTSIGGMTVDPDRWGADFFLGSSQKALGVPPGLAFAVASERFLHRAESVDDRGLYLDPVALHRDATQGRFGQTPALPIVHALDAQLTRIAAEGLPGPPGTSSVAPGACRGMGRRRMADAPSWPRPDAAPTPSLRSAFAPASRQSAWCRRWPRRGGSSPPGWTRNEDQVIRIGHMGDRTLAELDALLAALEPRL